MCFMSLRLLFFIDFIGSFFCSWNLSDTNSLPSMKKKKTISFRNMLPSQMVTRAKIRISKTVMWKKSTGLKNQTFTELNSKYFKPNIWLGLNCAKDTVTKQRVGLRTREVRVRSSHDCGGLWHCNSWGCVHDKTYRQRVIEHKSPISLKPDKNTNVGFREWMTAAKTAGQNTLFPPSWREPLQKQLFDTKLCIFN